MMPPRILTLDNMDEVSLQGTFDYYSLQGDPWEYFYIQQDRLIRGCKEEITLGDVYRLFAQGLQFHEVKEALHIGNRLLDRDVENKTILIGQAFYKAVNPGVDGFRRSNVIKALCDENIDEHNALDGAQRVFGYASHTTFEKLTGQPDTKVWAHAQEFDFIISKDCAQKAFRIGESDRDLTNCACDAWIDVLQRNGGVIDEEIRSMPIIIHIKNASADGRAIKRLLKKYKTEILNLAQQRKSPFIVLQKNAKPKIDDNFHYLELFYGGIRSGGKISERAATEKYIIQLSDLQIGLYMRVNPSDLNRDEKIEFRSTIRSVINERVQEIVGEHRSAEHRIPLLQGLIRQSKNISLANSILDGKTLNHLKQSVEKEREERRKRIVREKPRRDYNRRKQQDLVVV